MFVTGLTRPTVVSFAFSNGSAMISVLDEQKRVLDFLLMFPLRFHLVILSSSQSQADAALPVGGANLSQMSVLAFVQQ
jgi:hypothetical protein